MSGAWIVTCESGEYSDHSIKVLCVATDEQTARAAARHYAVEEGREERAWLKRHVRPTREGDAWHSDGFWVVVDVHEDDVGRDDDRSSNVYDSTFGFFWAAAFTPPAAGGGR